MHTDPDSYVKYLDPNPPSRYIRASYWRSTNQVRLSSKFWSFSCGSTTPRQFLLQSMKLSVYWASKKASKKQQRKQQLRAHLKAAAPDTSNKDPDSTLIDAVLNVSVWYPLSSYILLIASRLSFMPRSNCKALGSGSSSNGCLSRCNWSGII